MMMRYNKNMKITRPFNNEIIVVEDLATPEEADLLEEYALAFFQSKVHKDESLARLDLEEEAIRINQELEKRAHHVITTEFVMPSEPEFSTFKNYVLWKEGGKMEPHWDNVRWEHHQPIMFGSVYYVTEDFDGGETYYPNKGVQFKPKKGALIAHPGTKEYMHGINAVDNGWRITISLFCMQKDRNDPSFDYED